MTNDIFNYYKAVCEAYRLGNIESSYNAPIMALLAGFGCTARDLSGERSGATGENIDIKLWRGDDKPVETEPFAGIEVKKVGGIDGRTKTQIRKEAAKYGSAILTDNLTWEFWRTGEDKMYAEVRLIELADGSPVLNQENIELFVSLVKNFLLQDPTQIRSSGKLAEYMAMYARTIRNLVADILKDDGNGNPIINDGQKNLPMFLELLGLYRKIKEELRPAMGTREFADMYAQTVVYGLFIARHNDAGEGFDRYAAIGHLQEESALLSRFFTHIASTGKKHPMLEAVIDKLCALYRNCAISELLGQDGQRDTIIHFYEAFLTHYDPALRKSLGVFYTPAQTVRYLVGAVDRILVEDFGIPGGLSCNDRMTVTVPSERREVSKGKYAEQKEITTPRVAILDPACGTGSFHAEIIRYVKDTYFSGTREAFYENYIQNENGLMSRMIGFEIMMTSYVVAHLKIRRTIAETLGHTPDTPLPANVYLTNTLTPPQAGLERDEQISLFVDFSSAITDEAYRADAWKTRRPVKVVIGNPPYLAASTNPYDISAYKTETDGVTDFGERKHWLNDDYVKFFRFAEQIIEKNDEGILAFVSNNGYLDNPTFRGMRASLLRTFDRIYIVNLHGSAVKQEKTPDGDKDENIFDIMQGVSLFVGVRNPPSLRDTPFIPAIAERGLEDALFSPSPLSQKGGGGCAAGGFPWAKVYYCDLWGMRESKLQRLEKGDIEFAELRLDPKMAYFVPFGNDDKEAYENGVGVADLFPVNVTGILSGNDKAAIAPTREELRRRVGIAKNATDEKPILDLWQKFGRGQTAKKIQRDVLSPDGTVTRISFRPFDERWTYYTGNSCGWVFRPREKKTMGHLLKSSPTPIGANIGLVYPKGTNKFWDGVFISDSIIDAHFIDYPGRSIAYISPLYLYSEMDGTWGPNLDPDAFARLTGHMGFAPEPIEVFDYTYGVLHDPVYRERFDEFLKRDFPRVPVIESEPLFRAYAAAGGRLRGLHLMQTKAPAALAVEPNTPDDMEIGAAKYKDGVLHLNADKRILGISADVWGYRVGGYQVLDKWFKSHRGEALTIASFEHICNVAGLLAETIKVQEDLRGLHKTEIF